MFTLTDFIGLLWSFLLIYPIVSLIHVGGHAFFVTLFGGTFRAEIGRGKVLVKRDKLKIHRLYFLDSYVNYEGLRWNTHTTHFLVHAGGIIFNLGSALLLNLAIIQGCLEPSQVFEKFSYFSVWFAAFAILPVDYGNGKYSDGLSLYYILKHKKWPDLND